MIRPWRYENDYHTTIHLLYPRLGVFSSRECNRLAQLSGKAMIRAFYTPGYVFYTEFPGSGFLIDCVCSHCGKKATLVVEEFWKRYRKIFFKCSVCKSEVGSARFKGGKSP